VWLVSDLLGERRREPRLADTWFHGKQRNTPFAGFRLPLAAQQQIDLLGSADERRRARAQRLEKGSMRLGLRKPDEPLRIKVSQREQFANLPASRFADNQRVWPGQALQPGGQVWGFVDNGLFLRRAFADQIADDHQTCGNPDPRMEGDGFDIEATDRVD
jgi:hypothetical protein